MGELLADVSPAEAAAHPIEGAHSIWELVLHMTVWADVARSRLTDRSFDDPTPAQDWPPLPAKRTVESWTASVATLTAAYGELATVASTLNGTVLGEYVEGRDHTAVTLVAGVVEHGCYHGGQIALLKRALGK